MHGQALAGNSQRGQRWNAIGSLIRGGLQMFDRTQLYLGVAFLGVFELGVVLIRAVVR